MDTHDGIQRFLDDVDPVVLSRGQDYYRRGYVESIDYGEGHVTAEVSGSEDEPYLVDIAFDEDGEVEARMTGGRCASTRWRRCWPFRRNRRKNDPRKQLQRNPRFGSLWNVRKRSSLPR